MHPKHRVLIWTVRTFKKQKTYPKKQKKRTNKEISMLSQKVKTYLLDHCRSRGGEPVQVSRQKIAQGVGARGVASLRGALDTLEAQGDIFKIGGHSVSLSAALTRAETLNQDGDPWLGTAVTEHEPQPAVRGRRSGRLVGRSSDLDSSEHQSDDSNFTARLKVNETNTEKYNELSMLVQDYVLAKEPWKRYQETNAFEFMLFKDIVIAGMFEDNVGTVSEDELSKTHAALTKFRDLEQKNTTGTFPIELKLDCIKIDSNPPKQECHLAVYIGNGERSQLEKVKYERDKVSLDTFLRNLEKIHEFCERANSLNGKNGKTLRAIEDVGSISIPVKDSNKMLVAEETEEGEWWFNLEAKTKKVEVIKLHCMSKQKLPLVLEILIYDQNNKVKVCHKTLANSRQDFVSYGTAKYLLSQKAFSTSCWPFLKR